MKNLDQIDKIKQNYRLAQHPFNNSLFSVSRMFLLFHYCSMMGMRWTTVSFKWTYLCVIKVLFLRSMPFFELSFIIIFCTLSSGMNECRETGFPYRTTYNTSVGRRALIFIESREGRAQSVSNSFFVCFICLVILSVCFLRSWILWWAINEWFIIFYAQNYRTGLEFVRGIPSSEILICGVRMCVSLR